MTEYTKDDTIFVQISSYRDPEFQRTIQDLFNKAKKPENIFVGACHQYDMKEGTDKHLFEIPFPRPDQVRVFELDYRESRGLCYGRRQAQLLRKNEKWLMNIDAHMRFEQDWDEILILMLKSLQNKGYSKPVVGSYPPGYHPETGELEQPHITLLGIQSFNKDTGVLRMTGYNRFAFNYCSHSAFISGNFFATVSSAIKDVPYDGNICFTDEVNMASRLWTSGYDLFNLDKNVCYHLWNNESLKNTRARRAKDDAAWYHTRVARSDARERHLFGIEKSADPEVLIGLENCSAGNKRTLRDYERYSGINFRKRKLRERSVSGVFEKWQEVSKIREVKKIFKKSYVIHR